MRDEGPAHADIAVVLAGDYYGNRILRAAELVKQGYVPNVLVSGPAYDLRLYECDLEIPFAVKHGYPESWFIRAPNRSAQHARGSRRDFAGSAAPRRASISYW